MTAFVERRRGRECIRQEHTMSNRREVLQMGMALSVLPFGPGALAAPDLGPAQGEPLSFFRALFDTRFPASRAFGERMAARGIATVAMTGDMTSVWLDTLYPRWQKSAAPIAGLTAHGPLFCLERLAWDHGMRVVFRAQHSSSAEAVNHVIEGAPVPVRAAERVATDENWVNIVCDVIGSHSHAGASQASLRASTVRPALQVSTDEMLYSWVIAPVVRG
jgi:hypothetical protein